MVVSHDPPNSETWVSNLFPNFPVVNTTWEAIHVQFSIRKLVFTIILIAREGSIGQTYFSEGQIQSSVRWPRELNALQIEKTPAN